MTIEFWVGRDPDAAAADVRDRVARIMARLPEGIDLPVVRKVDSNAAAIMWIGVTSSTLDALELTEFLKRVYVDRLATVPGVATVYIGGERRYAMRIWVDRTALAARGLTVLDVESAIKKQNVELPGGLIASSKRELTVKADSRLATPGGVRAGRRLEQERLPRAPRRGRARSRSGRRTTASSSTRTATSRSASASCARRPRTR